MRAREELEGRAEHQNPYARLTVRELAVLDLAMVGKEDDEIARELGISPRTVDKHLTNILDKLSAASRTEAGSAMKARVTTSFDEAIEACRPFALLRLPPETRELLNSGAVLFYMAENTWRTCWPWYPIYPRRKIVRELKWRGVRIPKGVRVIITVELSADDSVERYMEDCFGHAILYLRNPRAPNECDDAQRTYDDLAARPDATGVKLASIAQARDT